MYDNCYECLINERDCKCLENNPNESHKFKNIIDLDAFINNSLKYDDDENEWDIDYEIEDEILEDQIQEKECHSLTKQDQLSKPKHKKPKIPKQETIQVHIKPQKYVSFSPKNNIGHSGLDEKRLKTARHPVRAKNLTYPVKIRSNYEIYTDRFDDYSGLHIEGQPTTSHMNEYFRPVIAAKKLGKLKKVPPKLENDRLDLLYNPIKHSSEKIHKVDCPKHGDTCKQNNLIKQDQAKIFSRKANVSDEHHLPKIEGFSSKQQDKFKSNSLLTIDSNLNDEINKLMSHFPSIQTQRGKSKKLLQLKNYLNMNFIKYSTTYPQQYNSNAISQYFASR